MEITLKRVDRIYYPGEIVSGYIVVSSKGSLSHQGITLAMEGNVQLQLSAKSVGLFEAFYNSIKPVQLFSLNVEVGKPGKLPDGTTELPFEFKLEAAPGQQLYETYHGVFVNVQYMIRADMKRGMLAKDLQSTMEFIVECPEKEPLKPSSLAYNLTPDSIEAVKKSAMKNIPKFQISGKIDNTTCDVRIPFTGSLTVDNADCKIKSVELQLVRVETCGCADGYAKEPTEIQNIQIADGDVCRGLEIPIFMIFPRLFTCPTLSTRTFKVEFEVNLVVMLENNSLISENFPIKLLRGPKN